MEIKELFKGHVFRKKRRAKPRYQMLHLIMERKTCVKKTISKDKRVEVEKFS